jgi:hypothetical protein
MHEADLYKNKQGKYVIEGNVKFFSTKFVGSAFFNDTQFSGVTSFMAAEFGDSAIFARAEFSSGANFMEAKFNSWTNFLGTKFSDGAYFVNVKFSGIRVFQKAEFYGNAYFYVVEMLNPASFEDIKFSENTMLKGLWNLSFGRIKKLEWEVTKFDMNTETFMDASTNPYLKRYIDDELWIKSWNQRKKHSAFNKFIFYFWELSSHCGRSISLWAGWSFVIALLFALAYTPAPDWSPDWWYNFWQEHGAALEQTTAAYSGKTPGFWSCLYFSIVNFTTLGFGDIVAANLFGRILVTIEVVLGYVMLGGLISIFANKFARRS